MTSSPGIVMMRLQYSVTLAALADVNDPSQSDPRIKKENSCKMQSSDTDQSAELM